MIFLEEKMLDLSADLTKHRRPPTPSSIRAHALTTTAIPALQRGPYRYVLQTHTDADLIAPGAVYAIGDAVTVDGTMWRITSIQDGGYRVRQCPAKPLN